MSKFFPFTILLLICALLGLLLPLIAQDSALSPAASETGSSWTETPLVTQSETATPSDMPSPSPEFIEILSPTPFLQSEEATEDLTLSLSPEITLQVTAELTEATAEGSETVAETIIFSPTETATASPTATALRHPDRILRGRVSYQVGANHTGILIEARDANGWQTSTFSDTQGIYNLELFSDTAYLLEFSAPGYLSQAIWVVAGDSVAPISLWGGDLNDDNCVNLLDIDILRLQFNTPSGDLDKDGTTGASDFAILAGNYNPDCGLDIEITVEPEAETTSELSPEIPIEVTEAATSLP